MAGICPPCSRIHFVVHPVMCPEGSTTIEVSVSPMMKVYFVRPSSELRWDILHSRTSCCIDNMYGKVC